MKKSLLGLIKCKSWLLCCTMNKDIVLSHVFEVVALLLCF